MKRSSPITSALLALVFAVPAISMAATKGQQNLSLSTATKVGNSQLQPGDYKVVWEGNGPDVQVSFVQGKTTVATAPAKLVQQPTGYDNAVETTGADNNRTLTSLEWRKQSLVFTSSVSNQQSGQ
jgi:hypothetical protein